MASAGFKKALVLAICYFIHYLCALFARKTFKYSIKKFLFIFSYLHFVIFCVPTIINSNVLL